MTIELSSVALRLSFEDLRHVRNIESQLLTAVTVLEATADTLEEIVKALSPRKKLDTTCKPSVNELTLKHLIKRCQCLVKSANEVQKRNDKLIQLASHFACSCDLD